MIKVFKDGYFLVEKKWTEEVTNFLEENKLDRLEVTIVPDSYIPWRLSTEMDGRRYVTNPYHIDKNDTIVNEWLTRKQYQEYQDACKY